MGMAAAPGFRLVMRVALPTVSGELGRAGQGIGKQFMRRPVSWWLEPTGPLHPPLAKITCISCRIWRICSAVGNVVSFAQTGAL